MEAIVWLTQVLSILLKNEGLDEVLKRLSNGGCSKLLLNLISINYLRFIIVACLFFGWQ